MAAKPAFLVYEIDDLALTLDLCLFAKAKFKELSLLSLLSLTPRKEHEPKEELRLFFNKSMGISRRMSIKFFNQIKGHRSKKKAPFLS